MVWIVLGTPSMYIVNMCTTLGIFSIKIRISVSNLELSIRIAIFT